MRTVETTIEFIKKGVVMVGIPALFAGSLVNVDISGGLIKIFLVMELFSKLYFTPVELPLNMGVLLQMLRGMDDFIKIDLTATALQHQMTHTAFTYKMSPISRNLLQESAATVVWLSLALMMHLYSVIILQSKTTVASMKYRRILHNMVQYIMEINLVDAIFIASHCLAGNHKENVFSG